MDNLMVKQKEKIFGSVVVNIWKQNFGTIDDNVDLVHDTIVVCN